MAQMSDVAHVDGDHGALHPHHADADHHAVAVGTEHAALVARGADALPWWVQGRDSFYLDSTASSKRASSKKATRRSGRKSTKAAKTACAVPRSQTGSGTKRVPATLAWDYGKLLKLLAGGKATKKRKAAKKRKATKKKGGPPR